MVGDDRIGTKLHLLVATTRYPNPTDLQVALLLERQSTANREMVQG